MTAIYMIRHGQASATSEDYDQLSALGEQQTQLLGAYLASQQLSFDTVFSGTMNRHKQSCDSTLTAAKSTFKVKQLSQLNELDHMELLIRFDGRLSSTAAMLALATEQDNPKAFFIEAFNGAVERWTSGKFDDEYSESWPAFLTRIESAMSLLTSEPGNRKLVFSSGGPISVMACLALGIPAEKFLTINHSLVNAGVSKFVVSRNGKLTLSTLNQHDYLEQQSKELISYT